MTPATSRTSTTWSWSWRTVGRWASGSAATARPPAQAARVAYQVCQALASAHQAGVVHGNLTPANILLAADGSVKVIDFATGGSDPGTLPPSRQQFQDAGGPSADPGGGWAGVVAPEAAAGGQPDGRADLYALGGCLYQMLTGRPPAPSGSPAGPGDQAMVCSPRAVLAGIPRELDQLVRQAMAGDPASRYQNADTMAVALAEAVTGLEDGVNAAGPPASPPVGWPAAHAEPTAGEGFLRHEGRWLGWALALVSLAAALAILGLTLGDSLGRDLVAGGAGTQREAGTATGTGGAGAILRLAGAFAYDPLGDGHENDDQAPKAIDQNPATAWTTQHYRRLALGGLKPGVGLVLALDQPVAARQLELRLLSPGGSLEVYGASGQAAPRSFPEGWTRLGGDPDPASRHAKLALAGDDRHRWYLVWFTRLPPAADDPASYQGGTNEATLRSS